MQRKFLFLLIVFCTTAGAEVYKRMGPDGQIYFSDRPGSDATRIEVTPAQAVGRSPRPDASDRQALPDPAPSRDAAPVYTEFTIISPENQEAVRANDGNVRVRMSLQPDLVPGHTIALTVDGEDGQHETIVQGTHLELLNLSRGRHTVEASVLDDKGEMLIHTGPISFQVLRVAAGG
jgi:hypothetical protein